MSGTATASIELSEERTAEPRTLLPQNRCLVLRGPHFLRFILAHADHPFRFAWSGSCWVGHIDGIPGGVQICNFEKRAEAEAYALRMGLRVENPERAT